MNKFALTLIALVGCKLDHTNKAELMVKAQQPKAACKSAKLDDTDVTVCSIATKDQVIRYIAAYGPEGFKPFPLTELPGAGEGSRATPPPAPAATPDAGTTPDAK